MIQKKMNTVTQKNCIFCQSKYDENYNKNTQRNIKKRQNKQKKTQFDDVPI